MSANNVNWQLVFQLVSALRHLSHDCELFERTAQELYEEMQKFGWRPMSECPSEEPVLVSFEDYPGNKVTAVGKKSAGYMHIDSYSMSIGVGFIDDWMPLPEPPNNHKPSKNE